MKTKTRGLEPIVAAVLLIVVAVIGAMLIYFWFAGYVTKTTSQVEQMSASERLKIEAASLTTNKATLYIRNIGGEAVALSHLYVLRPGSMSALCTAQINVSPIQPGQVSPVTVDLPANCNINAGHDYVLKIVTRKGTEFAVTVTAS